MSTRHHNKMTILKTKNRPDPNLNGVRSETPVIHQNTAVGISGILYASRRAKNGAEICAVSSYRVAYLTRKAQRYRNGGNYGEYDKENGNTLKSLCVVQLHNLIFHSDILRIYKNCSLIELVPIMREQIKFSLQPYIMRIRRFFK